MWLVPLSAMLDAHGLRSIKVWAFATNALAAFVSPLLFGGMADRSGSPVLVLRGLSFAAAVLAAMVGAALHFHWNPWLALGLDSGHGALPGAGLQPDFIHRHGPAAIRPVGIRTDPRHGHLGLDCRLLGHQRLPCRQLRPGCLSGRRRLPSGLPLRRLRPSSEVAPTGRASLLARAPGPGRAHASEKPRPPGHIHHRCGIQYSSDRFLSLWAAAYSRTGADPRERLDEPGANHGGPLDVRAGGAAAPLPVKMDFSLRSGHRRRPLCVVRSAVQGRVARRNNPAGRFLCLGLYHGPDLRGAARGPWLARAGAGVARI